jgi:hypothetical protein
MFLNAADSFREKVTGGGDFSSSAGAGFQPAGAARRPAEPKVRSDGDGGEAAVLRLRHDKKDKLPFAPLASQAA